MCSLSQSSVKHEGQRLAQVNISEPVGSCEPSQSDSSLQAQVYSLQQQLEVSYSQVALFFRAVFESLLCLSFVRLERSVLLVQIGF